MRSLFLSRIGLVLLLGGLMACSGNSSGGGSKSSVSTQMQGVWIQKDEAVELRTTGKMASLCAEVKKDPSSKIMNLRFIAADGSIYAYDPDMGLIDQLKMAVVSPAGQYTPTSAFGGDLDGATVVVSVNKDTLNLTFTFSKGGYSAAMDYLRSNDDEARRYYAAEKACN